MQIISLLPREKSLLFSSVEVFIEGLRKAGAAVDRADGLISIAPQEHSSSYDESFLKERQDAWKISKKLADLKKDTIIVPGLAISRSLVVNQQFSNKIIVVLTPKDERLLDREFFSKEYLTTILKNSLLVFADEKHATLIADKVPEYSDRIFRLDAESSEKFCNSEDNAPSQFLQWSLADVRILLLSQSDVRFNVLEYPDKRYTFLPIAVSADSSTNKLFICFKGRKTVDSLPTHAHIQQEYTKDLQSIPFLIKQLAYRESADCILIDSVTLANYCFAHSELKSMTFLLINELNVAEFCSLPKPKQGFFVRHGKRLIVSSEYMRSRLEHQNRDLVGKIRVWGHLADAGCQQPGEKNTLFRKAIDDALRLVNLPVQCKRSEADPLNLVVASHDFKFISPILDELKILNLYNLKLDKWKSQHVHDFSVSLSNLNSADVILCEFSSRNLVWYSRNKKRGQTLVARVHGYEVRGPWVDGIVLENVDKWIFVSETLRDQAVTAFGIGLDRCVVIPNGVDSLDLNRDKFEGARHNLGLVGMLPMIKRPDRALDLLARLRSVDPRYSLHIRSRHAFEFSWLWNDSDLRDAYLSFYDRVSRDPMIKGAVSFTSHGNDMGQWYRKVGWMLSTSTRESFHLAPVEGMASGAIPVVWSREGASDVFPEYSIFSDIDEITSFILNNNESLDKYRALSLSSREFSGTYDITRVAGKISEVLSEVYG